MDAIEFALEGHPSDYDSDTQATTLEGVRRSCRLTSAITDWALLRPYRGLNELLPKPDSK